MPRELPAPPAIKQEGAPDITVMVPKCPKEGSTKPDGFVALKVPTGVSMTADEVVAHLLNTMGQPPVAFLQANSTNTVAIKEPSISTSSMGFLSTSSSALASSMDSDVTFATDRDNFYAQIDDPFCLTIPVPNANFRLRIGNRIVPQLVGIKEPTLDYYGATSEVGAIKLVWY